ncbi:Uncharacterized protein ToN1_10490 [Aromatoleum petrolei]|nr:Uncharacterized protein ToN1_10490 [Aromatoleum petrolei]
MGTWKTREYTAKPSSLVRRLSASHRAGPGADKKSIRREPDA